MKSLFAAAALAALLGMGASELSAHHSFAAEYDGEAKLTITGKLNRVDWVNPHSWVVVDVTDATGKTVTWRCETAPPNGLIRRGWTKSSFKVGADISVEGYRAKDGSNTMSASVVTMNGKRMFAGSSGDGSPVKESDVK